MAGIGEALHGRQHLGVGVRGIIMDHDLPLRTGRPGAEVLTGVTLEPNRNGRPLDLGSCVLASGSGPIVQLVEELIRRKAR